MLKESEVLLAIGNARLGILDADQDLATDSSPLGKKHAINGQEGGNGYERKKDNPP